MPHVVQVQIDLASCVHFVPHFHTVQVVQKSPSQNPHQTASECTMLQSGTACMTEWMISTTQSRIRPAPVTPSVSRSQSRCAQNSFTWQALALVTEITLPATNELAFLPCSLIDCCHDGNYCQRKYTHERHWWWRAILRFEKRDIA